MSLRWLVTIHCLILLLESLTVLIDSLTLVQRWNSICDGLVLRGLTNPSSGSTLDDLSSGYTQTTFCSKSITSGSAKRIHCSLAVLEEETPLNVQAAELVARARSEIADIVHGRDQRLLVVVGPCSVRDTKLTI